MSLIVHLPDNEGATTVLAIYVGRPPMPVFKRFLSMRKALPHVIASTPSAGSGCSSSNVILSAVKREESLRFIEFKSRIIGILRSHSSLRMTFGQSRLRTCVGAAYTCRVYTLTGFPGVESLVQVIDSLNPMGYLGSSRSGYTHGQIGGEK